MASPVLDIEYLNAIGEFCKIYGGWAVAIFEGFFIMYLIRLQRKDRAEAAKRFAEFHDELVDLIKDATKTKMSISAKLLEVLRELRNNNNNNDNTVMSFLNGKEDKG